MKHHLLLIFYFLPLFYVTHTYGQANISGTINTYAQVTAINYGTSELTLNSSVGFALGDLVLLIQMQGATIQTGNTSTFGEVTSYNGVGQYELSTICEINGNTLRMENTFSNTVYNVGSGLQLIRVPVYNTGADVTATLTGTAWNGTTGGVLALAVNGVLEINAPIEMDGKGFRGGGYEDHGNCFFLNNYDDYYYSQAANNGGKKGEGIAAYIANRDYGRGKQANGGGGGNNHNAGGGGGSNATRGGSGGHQLRAGFGQCAGDKAGQGGWNLNTTNRLFMGGGGGAGQGNNGGGEGGANGGGIILIIADEIDNNSGDIISANGNNGIQANFDGAGGGGGGGSIHLEVTTFTNNLTVQARGGNGGNVDNQNTANCMGPGGGGSGGVIKSSTILPVNVTTNVSGGPSGNSLNVGSGCLAGAGGAQNSTGGNAGPVAVITTIPQSTTSSGCVLPVEWLSVDAKAYPRHTNISWSLAREWNNEFFTVERSFDGSAFEELANLPAGGTTYESTTYAWQDPYPIAGKTYYRIRQTDFNGNTSLSEVVEVVPKGVFQASLFPNPLSEGQLMLRINLPKKTPVRITAYNQVGQQIIYHKSVLAPGLQDLPMDFGHLPAGLYQVRIQTEGRQQTLPLIVR
ncbi:MAG: T9SS type A sorting domain-containing protein [Bacteroidota bacterium]